MNNNVEYGIIIRCKTYFLLLLLDPEISLGLKFRRKIESFIKWCQKCTDGTSVFKVIFCKTHILCLDWRLDQSVDSTIIIDYLWSWIRVVLGLQFWQQKPASVATSHHLKFRRDSFIKWCGRCTDIFSAINNIMKKRKLFDNTHFDRTYFFLIMRRPVWMSLD